MNAKRIVHAYLRSWKTKARIMRACSAMPEAESLYRLIQKRFGRLNGHPQWRLGTTVELLQMLQRHGASSGGRFLEVGTGHVPVVPIGLFLAGAAEVWTYDLHRRLDGDMVRRALRWIVEHQQFIIDAFAGLAHDGTLRARLRLLSDITSVAELLEATTIRYIAPGDAAKTGLPANSIDCHFSITTLEHISVPAIREIFREARRIIVPSGFAVHFIDCSDHFEHTDSSLTKINFLKFSERDWLKIAGNAFAYCNRLRASDYSREFTSAGFAAVEEHREVDESSLSALCDGFMLDEVFRQYSDVDLCTTAYDVLLQPQKGSAAKGPQCCTYGK